MAIIGAACSAGRDLCRLLAASPGVEAVFAVDEVAPDPLPADVTFIRRAADAPIADVILESWVDSVVYLAYAPGRALPGREAQLGALERVLSACHRGGVQGLVVGSSARVYGPSWERPAPRPESSPLEADRLPFEGIQGLVAVERQLEIFAAEHPEVSVAVARPVSVLGPRSADLIAGALTRRPLGVLPSPTAPLQVCHSADYPRALLHLLDRGARGAYNVAPSDVLGSADLTAALGGRALYVRTSLLREGIGLGQRLGFFQGHRGQGGAEALAYLGAPWLADGKKLRDNLSFRFLYGSREALEAFLAPTSPSPHWGRGLARSLLGS